MTSIQVYGLVAPFILLGVGWLAVWWNHYDNERNRRRAGLKQQDPAA
jgi:hypothetical protein